MKSFSVSVSIPQIPSSKYIGFKQIESMQNMDILVSIPNRLQPVFEKYETQTNSVPIMMMSLDFDLLLKPEIRC